MADKRTERFENAHKRMVEDGVPIPHRILRDYLDSLIRDKHSGSMARRALTITMNRSWLNQFPPMQRRDIVKMIFSLAAQFGYDIRVAGEKW